MDRRFLMASSTLNTKNKSKFYRISTILDQRSSFACVGFACAQFIQSAPQMSERPNPFEIYMLAQKLDEWQGEEPDYFGTSVRAGMKAMESLGLIKGGYVWAWDAKTIINYVLTRGTVVVGTPWLSGMTEPDKFGNVSLTGEDNGGHAWLIGGVDTEKGKFLGVNSWGEKWGVGGKFWISIEDLDKLLLKGGVACSALEKAS